MSLKTIFHEIPPTAGFPIKLKDFFHGSSAKNLEKEASFFLEEQFTRITCSGTAALYLILQSIKKLSSKRKIIIPSFICPLVPLAIHRAGFEVMVINIDSSMKSFDYDEEELKKVCEDEGHSIAAVIACHLGGIPLDMDFLEGLVSGKNIFLIEDAAQALGAFYKGQRPVGTRGDFSFFSLCRGKGPSMFEGGILTTKHSHYASLIDEEIKKHIPSKPFFELKRIIELLAYALFYRPFFMFFVFKAPELYYKRKGDKIKALGEDFDLDFPLHKVSSFRQYLAIGPFRRLKKEVKRQREKAASLMESIKKDINLSLNFFVIEERKGDESNYPYLCIRAKSEQLKEKILKKTQRSGMGISEIYAYSIDAYPYLNKILNFYYPYKEKQVRIDAHVFTLSTSIFTENPSNPQNFKNKEIISFLN